MLGVVHRIAESITNLAGDIVNGLKEAIVKPILDGIKSIFVPSEDYISQKVNTLLEKFSFARSIYDTFTLLKDSITHYATEPPVIRLELSNNNSQFGYNFGAQTVEIDFSWYESWKPYIDTILSALILLGFAWRQFHKLPTTISGQASSFSQMYRRSQD